ncbi:MAG TPA: ABC transporter permease, partial [Thalassospira sp.]|nr:ABC transporter permease [Thalassospira sp.]
DPYLLPTIAAIILGGTNVLGGRGKYVGTIAGVILITILQSMLSVVQPQRYFAQLGVDIPADTFRQVVFGAVIIGMLLIYGRQQLVR